MQLENIIFKDRDDATNRLIEVLPINEMLQEDWIVIATSAGSVPIALKISKVLDADFDFLFTQKIFTPKNNDCEIAIISETGEIVIMPGNVPHAVAAEEKFKMLLTMIRA